MKAVAVTATGYDPAPGLLANRVVLVTGAGDGIGRAAATTFARLGGTVVLLGRTVRKLEAAYDTIVEGGYPEPAIYPMDLAGASPADYDDLAQRVEDQLGRLDGILHNAGVLGTLAPLAQWEPEEWLHVMQVNVNAAFLLTRATFPLLERAPDSSIVFTTAGVGHRGRAYWGAYCASKFATEGLMQLLADEVDGRGRIRVNAVNPGAVRTRMRASAYPAEDPSTLAAPEDVMGAYAYLMGPDAQGINGRIVDAQSP